MGSHYSQCFASKQTIAPGDRCFALALSQQRTYSRVSMTHGGKSHSLDGISHGAIWPDAYWVPVGNFIEGIYRSSGDIEVAKDPVNVRRLYVFIRLMLTNAPVVKEGENTVHDLAYDLPRFVAETCPVLQAYVDAHPDRSYGELVAPLTEDECTAMYDELVAAWTYTDDVAFKHRVFYADFQGSLRPLQFTLLHGVTYDKLLSSTTTTAADLFAKALAATAEMRARPGFSERLTAPQADDMPADVAAVFSQYHDMAREALARFFWTPTESLGMFDSIRYFEVHQGLADCIRDHALGQMTDAELFVRVKRVFDDRLVVMCLESYSLKFAPKVILFEDNHNELGKAYSDFVRSVSKDVSAERKLVAAARG